MNDASLVDAYYKLIKAGRRTIDTILPKYREEVQALLDKDKSPMTTTSEDA